MAVVLDARGLNKRFGAVTAATNINAAIEQDSVVGLIGTNGAGKTTFINMITGYIKPDSGSIHFQGRDITALSPREVTRVGICRSFQIPQLYASLSVFEHMMVGLGVVLRNAGLGGYFSRGRPNVPGHDAPAEEVAASSRVSGLAITATRMRKCCPAACASCSISPSPWSPSR